MEQSTKMGVFILIAFVFGAVTALDKTSPVLPPQVCENKVMETKEVLVYNDGEKLPNCVVDDSKPCAYSMAPEGMGVFIPNK